MTIDVTYDLVCPWCFLGLSRLQRALARMPSPPPVEIWPFQLTPDLPKEGVDHFEFFAGRVGPDRVAGIYATMEDRARQEGLVIAYGKIKTLPNTELAHRAVQAAQTGAPQLQFTVDLMEAYFTAGRDLGDPIVIAQVAATRGLTREALDASWSDPQTVARIACSVARSAQLGIRGVPHMMTGGRQLPGDLSEDQLVEALHQTA